MSLGGWRSLVGCSPWGRYESDMTEWPHVLFPLSGIGEGNGNPFQYSYLKNPRDRGAWWAAINGVAQSQTWLKQLSSSSSYPSLSLYRDSGYIQSTVFTNHSPGQNLSLWLLSQEKSWKGKEFGIKVTCFLSPTSWSWDLGRVTWLLPILFPNMKWNNVCPTGWL